MSKITVIITLTDPMLGSWPANPDLHLEHVAKKSQDAEKIEQELAAMGANELLDKGTTVFARSSDGSGRPVLWDYQIRGFFKEAINALRDIPDSFVHRECKKEKGDKRLSKWSHKRTVDNLIFATPREILLHLPPGSAIEHCTRSMRVITMQGERVCLATSEQVPAGTWFTCEITVLDARLDDLIPECLNYGAFKGLGQWRNSGKGRFSWTLPNLVSAAAQ